MRLRVDHTHTASLVRFFRSRDFLAVPRGRGLVDVVPLIALSENADRRRMIRLLAEWQRENQGITVELVEN